MALTEGKNISDWLKYEVNQDYTREELTIKSGEDLVSGTVIALDNGGTEYVAFEDDTDTPAIGILVNAVDASAAAKTGVVIVRGPVVINPNKLTWHASNDATDILNGLADLKALGIIAAEGA